MVHFWWLALLALLAGTCIPTQAGINARLSLWTRSPVLAATISFLVGTVALAGYVMATRLPLPPLRRDLTRTRILLLSGRHHETLALGRELEPKLREVGFGPDLAALLVLLARGEMQLGESESAEAHCREAIELALEYRRDHGLDIPADTAEEVQIRKVEIAVVV